jgi:hypothetical protein
VFECFIVFLNSVFLEPFTFFPDSICSLYEGKSSLMTFVLSTICSVFSFLDSLLVNVPLRLALTLALVAVSVIGVYHRILPFPHVSIIGQYFNTSTIICAPLMLFWHFLFDSIGSLLLAFFATHILYLIILVVTRRQLERRLIEMFNVMTNRSDSKSVFSAIGGISPHNYVTVIRSYVAKIADPEAFEQFCQLQMQIQRRASIQIEIVRFLGIFPSRRERLIREIDLVPSKSLYNRFMLALLRSLLQDLVADSTESDRRDAQALFEDYVTVMSDFWYSRICSASLCALAFGRRAVFLLAELDSEFRALLLRFPFDGEVRRLYTEYLCLTTGDHDSIRAQKNIREELLRDRIRVTDPLLTPLCP